MPKLHERGVVVVRIIWLFVVVSLFNFSAGCSNESLDSKSLNKVSENNPSTVIPMLPAYPLPGERKGAGKADENNNYRLANPGIYGITNAPKTPMRAVAQWESGHQALLLGWTGSFPQTNAAIVQAAKSVTTIHVVHMGTASKNDFINKMNSYGVSTSGIKYINTKLNSIWMRDYGPLSVRTPDGTVAFVDPKYYSNRVFDDAIPHVVGQNLGINVYKQPVQWEGGTYIADGYGNCYYSQGVFWYGGTSPTNIQKYQKDYLGCDTQIVVKPLQDEGTTHSDMFSKLTSKNTMVLGKYESWQDSGNKTVLDQNESILKAATLNDGSKINVVRIPMPSNSGRSVWRTYVNSLLINGKNLIPVYSDKTTYESQAMSVWQSVLPNTQHIKIDSTDLIEWSGAIHCITMTVPGGALKKDGTSPSYLCNGSYDCSPTNTKGTTCSLKFEGCCNGSSLNQCQNASEKTINCGNQGCGWSEKYKSYACAGNGAGPANAPLQCDQTCTPNCTNKSCGSDGCGGSCGNCTGTQTCQNGTCVDDASGQDCGNITFQGCCSGNVIKYCEDNKLESVNCQNCGWNATNKFYDCGYTGADPSGTHPKACVEECQPNCNDKACGSDGCGGSCGTCDAGSTCNNGQCVCEPNCTGKSCGSNGCGGSCGTCAAGQACNTEGQCISNCTPNCTNKSCGGDGCGGSCGACDAGQTCQNGTCSSPQGCGDIGFLGQCNGNILTWCEDNQLSTYDCSKLDNHVCKAAPGSNPPNYDCFPSGRACTPDCTNKTCGADGCGGICGSCAPGENCTNGQCTAPGASGCNGLSFEGCCDGNVLNWCGSGTKNTINCENNSCGWNAGGNNGKGWYDCNGQGADPSGKNPLACGELACVPDCSNKICGSNGCGGVCGVCTGGTTCQAGKCLEPADTFSYGSPCSGLSYEGGCKGNYAGYCNNGKIQGADCKTITPGSCCGWNSTENYYDCLPESQCGSCINECAEGSKGCSEFKTHQWTCEKAASGCFERKFSDCGDQLCEANSNSCPGGGPPPCQPNCSNKTCGTDGCGGSCGTCLAGQSCNAAGKCVSNCTPNCTGKACGSDGCGGSCGTCNAGTICDPQGICIQSSCVPKCEGKICGDDGCGGSCGTCPAGQACNKQGACINAVCAPNCENKQCGDDGCGGSCGVCGKSTTCKDGLCIDVPQTNCGSIPINGVCVGSVLKSCNEKGEITTIDCTTLNKLCGPNGNGGFDCVDKSACVPQCESKQCGPDGCGGVCGSCSKGSTCTTDGVCISSSCKPNCAGKQCGTDGCGGSCGQCNQGFVCNSSSYQCVSTGQTNNMNQVSDNTVNPPGPAEFTAAEEDDGCGCRVAGASNSKPKGGGLLIFAAFLFAITLLRRRQLVVE